MLGRGGMGEVYRADDLRLGQTVALKFLPPELAKDAKRLEYFHNEVRLARQISHPNVCRVFDIGEVDGQQFISMEYIDGEDLKSLLHRIGRLPKDKGLQVAHQLCAGLAAAHAKYVLHRDLKPANVMLDGQGQVRITDFGLATTPSDGDNVIGMSGTPAYMAPEQLLRAQSSIQSDIYSLGLVLFELFVGKRAHQVSSIADLRELHEDFSVRRGPKDFIDEIDPVVDRVIARCLDADPENRPRSVTEILAGLPGETSLAVILAAGETPSPEMVAAAVATSKFSVRLAYGAFSVILVGLVFVFVLSTNVLLLDQLDLVHSPPILRSKATEMMERFGLTDSVVDDAYGIESPFHIDGATLKKYGTDATGFAESVWFWYRTSPEMFRSMAPFEERARIFEDHPAWDVPGMCGMRLDFAGNLRWYRRIPTVPLSNSTEIAIPRWEEWFDSDVIGFDLSQLIPADAKLSSIDPFDSAQAWKGTIPLLGEVEVIAASYDDKPSFFSVLPVTAQEGKSPSDSPFVAFQGISLVACFAAFVLAYRNNANGRGDRKGAWSLAVIIFTLELTAWCLMAHHSISAHEKTVFWLALASALREGFLGFVSYLAAEPLIRRTWPMSLTTWNRLIRGGWTDPRVAQDVLMGIALGVSVVVLSLAMQNYFDVYSGFSPRHGGYLGGRIQFGEMTGMLQSGIMMAMGGLVIIAILELLLRSKKAAIIVWILLLTPVLGQLSGIPFTGWLLRGTLPLVATAYVYARHGVVGVATSHFILFILLIIPVTSNTSAYYFENGLVSVGITLLLSTVAFKNSLT
jgi:serine/threonine-protein kinase